jgi:hypothetical protein
VCRTPLFDHDQTEGFRPVDRKQQSRGPSEKALLHFVVDCAGQLDAFAIDLGFEAFLK